MVWYLFKTSKQNSAFPGSILTTTQTACSFPPPSSGCLFPLVQTLAAFQARLILPGTSSSTKPPQPAPQHPRPFPDCFCKIKASWGCLPHCRKACRSQSDPRWERSRRGQVPFGGSGAGTGLAAASQPPQPSCSRKSGVGKCQTQLRVHPPNSAGEWICPWTTLPWTTFPHPPG